MSISWWIDKTWSGQAVGYHSAMKRNGVDTCCAATWMNLESIVVSKSQLRFGQERCWMYRSAWHLAHWTKALSLIYLKCAEDTTSKSAGYTVHWRVSIVCPQGHVPAWELWLSTRRPSSYSPQERSKFEVRFCTIVVKISCQTIVVWGPSELLNIKSTDPLTWDVFLFI